MEIHAFPAAELETVFRVLRTALDPVRPLEPREWKFLETYSRITGWRWPPGSELPPIAPKDVRIEGAHRRKRLVQLASIAALFNHPIRFASVLFVKTLASSLAVSDPVIPVLDALGEGRTSRARVMTVRRGMRVLLKEAHLAEGIPGVARFLAAMLFRVGVNRDKAWGYKKLGLLPEGTLGREFWKHLTSLGFGFPGEPAGLAESVAYHDVSHVLTGYDTTPSGEIQQGCFQGGNRREDGFFFIQFAILQFHQGIQLTPIAKPEVGNFDPVNVLWAIHRGASCNVDMTHQWKYWPLMPLALEEVRQKCGLLPKLEPRREAA